MKKILLGTHLFIGSDLQQIYERSNVREITHIYCQFNEDKSLSYFVTNYTHVSGALSVRYL